MEKDIIEGLKLLKASEKREKILRLLGSGKILTPTEIAQQTDVIVNHVSIVLREFKDNNLIICLNEEDKKGRLYQITKKGKKVLELI